MGDQLVPTPSYPDGAATSGPPAAVWLDANSKDVRPLLFFVNALVMGLPYSLAGSRMAAEL
jgi:hypothetical protein